MEEEMIKPRVDEIMEHFNVSGVLHVTVDNGSIHTLMFNQHVRIHIAFNNEKQIKELDRIPFVKTEIFSNEMVESRDEGEDDDIGVDEGVSRSRDDSSDLDSRIKSSNLTENSIVSCAKKKGSRSKKTAKRNISGHLDESTEEVKPKKGKLGKRKKAAALNSSGKCGSLSTKNGNNSFEFDDGTGFKSAETSAPVRKRKPRKKLSTSISKKGNTSKLSKSESTDQPFNASTQSPSTLKSPVTDSIQTSTPGDHTTSNSQTGKREPQETFFCTFCSQYFESAAALKSHHKVIDSEKYDCSKCTKSFKTKAYLLTHEMFYHPEEGTSYEDSKGTKKYICRECGKSIFYNSVRPHMLLHTGEKLYKCCVCSLQITSVYDHFKTHLQKHIIGEMKFECKPCHIYFDSRGELSAHQLTHALKCDLCGLMFSSRTGRNFHYKTVHEHDIRKCPLCNGLYPSEKALADHMKYHGKRPKKQCPVCGEMFVSVRKHMRVVHPDDPNIFMCDKCPKTFRTKTALTQHVNVHHLNGPGDNQLLYPCHICDRQYPTSAGLRKHLLTHSEEKPYVCNICGKACKLAGNLKTHMKVHNKPRSANNVTIGSSVINNDGLGIGNFSNAGMSISYAPNY